jgi:hypothetical protein
MGVRPPFMWGLTPMKKLEIGEMLFSISLLYYSLYLITITIKNIPIINMAAPEPYLPSIRSYTEAIMLSTPIRKKIVFIIINPPYLLLYKITKAPIT